MSRRASKQRGVAALLGKKLGPVNYKYTCGSSTKKESSEAATSKDSSTKLNIQLENSTFSMKKQ